MGSVRKSILASVVEKYLSQAIGVLTLAVMSRLLTPAEVGLYLLANMVILLSDNLRAFGVGIFIVQERVLTLSVLRSVFTISALMSMAVALLILAAGDAMARYFGQPELDRLLRLSVIGFLAAPVSIPILAVLQRELEFVTLALINVVAAIAGAGVTIALGLMGHGPDSYVWGFIVTTGCIALMAVVARPNLSAYVPSLTGAGRILSFGAISSSVTLLNMAFEFLPRFALARTIGVEAVGTYGRTLTICQLPDRALVSGVQPVVLPSMAAQVREDGDIRSSYLRGFELMSALQWPTLLILALLADPIVDLLLGPQWGEVPSLVRMIAIAMMASAPAFMTFPVLVSVGRVRDTLTSSLISLPPSALVLIAASTISLQAMAASMLLILPFQMAVALVYVRRAIGFRWRAFASAVRSSAMVTAGAAVGPVAIVLLSPNGLHLGLLETGLALAAGVVGWVTAVMVLHHPIRAELLAAWRMIVDRQRRPALSPENR
ncbi:oligosaccharide flippase family protein [Pseudooceanicola sp. LIPI14-2-Ac024]|uniref:oligosaccharide flippase family protein n=1 Tax=Pseudooceanicola sp. LIPI14-2-Ac024 TaxID=3344875 RepID=UPI0035CEAF20